MLSISSKSKDMKTPQELYDELSYYTLSLKDPEFIHQHIVDAFCAQNADSKTKSIALTFALVGLYLYLEKNYTGHEVQNAHIQMAKKRKKWPIFVLPLVRGEITVKDVLNSSIGNDRIRMIRKWCESVWREYKDSHLIIRGLVGSVLYS